MIDFNELKKGDEVFRFRYECVYSCDDVDIPNGIVALYFLGIGKDNYYTFTETKGSDDVDRFYPIKKWYDDDRENLYKKREEAEKALKKERLKSWKEFDCDKMLKALLKVKKEIENENNKPKH